MFLFWKMQTLPNGSPLPVYNSNQIIILIENYRFSRKHNLKKR